MSLREKFEAEMKTTEPDLCLDRHHDGDYFWAAAKGRWAAYQSATERALRIVREELAKIEMSGASRACVRVMQRRIKGDDSNG